MKPNLFLFIIAAALTAIFAYSVFSYSVESRKIMSTIVFSLIFLIYSGILLGVRMDYEKGQILKNTVSILFTLYTLIITTFFIGTEYTKPLYLLINIVPLLIYGIIINFFTKAKY